uniref:Peptidase S1 domain-containing protein n=1 Tax=Acrobeloides nanus TaxID=290746 RepID=A0A914E031_9BILA
MGVIEFFYSNSEPYLCGTTLISPEYALTSADCVITLVNLPAYIGHTVRFGIVDLNDKTALNNSVLTVTSPSNYISNSSMTINDIAILKLKTPVNLSNNIKPISIPKNDVGLIERTNVITGWGYYSINCGGNNVNNTIVGNMSQNLLKASVTVIDYITCR